MAWFGAANPARRIHANVHVATVCVGLLFYSGIGGANPEGSKAFLDVRTILDAWEANYGSIRSMKVVYSARIEDTDAEGRPRRSHLHVERIEDGKLYHNLCSEAEQGLADKSSIVESSFDGEVSKHYTAVWRSGWLDRGLKNMAFANMNDLRRCMMMKRVLIPQLKEDFPEGAPWFSVLIREGLEGHWSKVLPELEPVAGEPCHVIERHRPGDTNTDKIWVAHAKGMLLMKHEVIQEGETIRACEVRNVASVATDKGEFWYPRKMRSETRGSSVWEIEVYECVPHVSVPPGAFDVHFPHGTLIADHIAGTEYLQN